ncbi:hypothetical protein [Streptomyces sp. MUM 2J]|uniref:hypothetical protein n=1 Tax=Streptomyces sp. MUM 2J TaxID=2791987 RepID=UPI001F04F75E|nr:hypothetical protein [Streptomyces sp. MUM 2J]MCH0566152.1 LysR family transcriptional regulator [Streptomyces sp. MUM 2J]
MDVSYLNTFLAVAGWPNSSKATGQLNLFQQTVTARIKRLEASLFLRGAAGAGHTEARVRLQGYARSIVQLSEFAQRAVTVTDQASPSQHAKGR